MLSDVYNSAEWSKYFIEVDRKTEYDSVHQSAAILRKTVH